MIECKNLTKDYGPIRAVNDVTFRVEPGQVLGFLGPNGAGKSTTMRMLTGFLTPTSGTATIAGYDVREQPVQAKSRFGYLPENGPLYPEMTVLEFLTFCGELRGLSGQKLSAALDRVLEVCSLLGVRHQTIETLSKGFRQRVGMAQAIIHDPDVLIMDEPTDGLDPNQKQTVRKLIRGMAEKKAIILSTHILEEVDAVCNRVIIIARGHVLVDETPAELHARHPLAGAVTAVPGASTNPGALRDKILQGKEFSRVEVQDGAVLVVPKKGANAMVELIKLQKSQNLDIAELQPVRTRLDDVFRELTQPKTLGSDSESEKASA